MKRLVFTGAVVASLLCPSISRAQQTPPLPVTIAQQTSSRDAGPFQFLEEHCMPSWGEIERSLLVGTYQHLNGFTGMEVILHANGGYSLTSFSDLIVGMDWTNERGRSYGAWSLRQDHAGAWVGVVNELVVLTPTDDTRERRFLTKPLVLYPVRWQQRLYLLRAEDFAPFRDAVVAAYGKTGQSFPVRDFLLREGDDTKAVWGLPEFPFRWRSLLINVPPLVSVATFLSVEPDKSTMWRNDAFRHPGNYSDRITLLAEMPWLLPKFIIGVPPPVREND